MLNLAFAAIGPTAPMSLTGTFTKTAAPSGGIVTSDPVTVGVPLGTDGKLAVSSRLDVGTVTLEFERNASGTWVDETLLNTVVFANGDTVKSRIRNASSGESSQFSVAQNSSGRVLRTNDTLTAA